jgi:Tfp pilus assembly protein PilZ
MLVIRWANFVDFAGRLIRPRGAREYHRVRAHNLIRYYDPFAEIPELITNIVNLSESGLQISVRSKIKIGTEIRMVINLVERNQDIPVVGKVMWIKGVRGKGTAYRVGVKFDQISAEHRSLLRSLVTEKKTA